MIRRYWQMMILTVKLKKFIPFKIYNAARVRITSPGKFITDSRVVIGNPDKKSAIVSRSITNVWIGENAEVHIGKGVSIGPGVNLIVKNNAHCEIGEATYFTSDMHIEVINKLKIGSNCAISWGVTIIDDDHHEMIRSGNENKTIPEVHIGNHVWIGCNATILKNSFIGNNCVVAAGSVVKGTFPDSSLIGGNPARIIKENIEWK